MHDNDQKVLSTGQAARRLGVDPETVKRYIVKGKLRAFRLPGGAYRIWEDSVDAIREGRRVSSD